MYILMCVFVKQHDKLEVSFEQRDELEFIQNRLFELAFNIQNSESTELIPGM